MNEPPSKESQVERCSRVLAGCRGKVRVERASVYFDDVGEAHARVVAAREAEREAPGVG